MAILKAVLDTLLKKKNVSITVHRCAKHERKKIREGTSNFSYFENILGKVNLY